MRQEDLLHCELRDHGPADAVEATFYQVGELLTSRLFEARLDRTRTPRALAIQWAEEERRALESSGIVL